MGLIEQAAKRLEELRRAGVEIPAEAERPGSPAPAAAPAAPVQAPEPVAVPPGMSLHVAPHAAAPAAEPVRTPRKPPKHRVDLDLDRLATAGFLTPKGPRSRLADEFRVIKRPIVANATGKSAAPVRHGNLVMVTSSLPGEGKTFTSVNLAMSLAMELDRTVLLVDGDVARPSLPKTLGITPREGLLDLLSGSSRDPADLILGTNVDGLALLPAGTQSQTAAEMLASEAMSGLLDRLSREDPERIVVFDSPPLLVTTEARQLATYMGQVVFVVRAEATLQGQVQSALATIEACPVKLMLLNAVTGTGNAAYGYGYGYGYGK